MLPALKCWVTLNPDDASTERILFRCCIGDCSFICCKRVDLRMHLVSHKSVDVQAQCKCPLRNCDMLFNGDIAYQNHLSFHVYEAVLQRQGLDLVLKHADKRSPLPICSQTALRETDKLVYDGSILSCQWSDCTTTLNDMEQYLLHVDNHVGKNDFRGTGQWPCKWRGCSVVVKTAYFLRRHLKTHTGERACACPYCGVHFSNNTKLRDHLFRQQKLCEYQCKFCQKKFATERLLHEHGRVHISRFKCPLCSVPTVSPSSLRNHFLHFHQNMACYRCNDCGRRFKTKHSLFMHRLKHKPRVTGFPCELCSKKFASRHSIAMHMRIVHLKRRLYHCHLCNGRLTRGVFLTKHLQLQHGIYLINRGKFRYKLCEDGFYRIWDTRLQLENVITPSVDKIRADIAEKEKIVINTVVYQPQSDISILNVI